MKVLQSLFGASERNHPVQEIAQVAGPWQQIAAVRIGGLTALGFDRNSEDMLVTSARGPSVISGTTAQILYRNADADGLGIAALKGTRLDHPADVRFDMAGIYGGGLRVLTVDGWSVAREVGQSVLHSPAMVPNGSGQNDRVTYMLDNAAETPRVLGFSWTGRTLVCATADTLSIWGRPAPLTL